jgi:hypothetical protein
MATHIRVAAVDQGWQVRFNGLPHGHYQVKKAAVSDARKLAREHRPEARVDVQNQFTGSWKTVVTW